MTKSLQILPPEIGY